MAEKKHQPQFLPQLPPPGISSSKSLERRGKQKPSTLQHQRAGNSPLWVCFRTLGLASDPAKSICFCGLLLLLFRFYSFSERKDPPQFGLGGCTPWREARGGFRSSRIRNASPPKPLTLPPPNSSSMPFAGTPGDSVAATPSDVINAALHQRRQSAVIPPSPITPPVSPAYT